MATGSMSKGPGKSYREGLSLDRLFRMFPTDEAAEAWFTAERWPDGPYCPHYGSRNIQCGIAQALALRHDVVDRIDVDRLRCDDGPSWGRCGAIMNSSMHQRVVHPSSGSDGIRLQIRQSPHVRFVLSHSMNSTPHPVIRKALIKAM